MTKPIVQGSWIDIVHPLARDGVYWNRKTIAYTDEDWLRLITHLRRDLGCKYLVLTNVAVHDGWFLYPSKLATSYAPGKTRHWKCKSPDPVNAILSAAATEQVSVFVGVGAYPGPSSSSLVPTKDAKADSLRWSGEVAEELLARYGHHRSFHGFYITGEFWFEAATGLFQTEHVEWAHGYTDALHALRPGIQILSAPFHPFNIAKARPDVSALAACIEGTGVDILSPQDGVGFDTPDSPRPADISAESFAMLAQACRQTRVRLWAEVEVFRFENDLHFQPLLPAPFERIRRQMESVAPYVEILAAYQMPGLMTSQKVCPDLGVAETELLYQEYVRYLRGESDRENDVRARMEHAKNPTPG